MPRAAAQTISADAPFSFSDEFSSLHKENDMSAQPIETTAPAIAAAKPRKAEVPRIQAIRQQLPAVDHAAPSHQVAGARLLELEQQWRTGMAAAETRGLSEEDLDALSTALMHIEMEIASSPCDSMGAFMAKLRTVVRHGVVHGQITAIDDATVIDGMIAFMEGRFRETGDPTAECEVERLSDDFSGAIRTHDRLDGVSQEGDALDRINETILTIREGVFAHTPRNRSGVAFQLLVAASHLDVVQHATRHEADVSDRLIRTAIVNTLRVLSLPFDYRAAEYFIGPLADGLDGRARQGPLQ